MLVEVSLPAGSNILGCSSAVCNGWQMNLVLQSLLQTRWNSPYSRQPRAPFKTFQLHTIGLIWPESNLHLIVYACRSWRRLMA